MIIYIVKVSDLEKKWTLSPWPSEDVWQVSYEKNAFFTPQNSIFSPQNIFRKFFQSDIGTYT